MIRNGLLLFFLIACLAPGGRAQEVVHQGPSLDFSHGKLKVSANQRFLQFEDGTPFFYLGDTAWELFHRLSTKEAERYLENRREKGFTVIQAVILAELYGLGTPNVNGHVPLVDYDPAKPVEAYFAHVDKVIRMAEEKGLFIGLLPTWGDKVDQRWGVGPLIFNEKNAFEYGRYVGNRYKDFRNIIWVDGGDRSGGDGNEGVWRALARGIKSVDANHLMTFHPWGGRSSSIYFHEDDWLDFNMMQTGHTDRTYATYKLTLVKDYQLEPIKPSFDGEPCYEDHPVWWNPEVLGWFMDADVRMKAYWNVFSGGFGHTYGAHPVWQMHAPGRPPIGHVRNYWYDVLDLPGAWDMIHLRRLMESRPFMSRVPFQELIANDYVPEKDYIVATKGDGYAMVYTPSGVTVEADLTLLDYKESRAGWYNPRTGEYTEVGIFANDQVVRFEPDYETRGDDWVLLLDDASKKFTK